MKIIKKRISKSPQKSPTSPKHRKLQGTKSPKKVQNFEILKLKTNINLMPLITPDIKTIASNNPTFQKLKQTQD